MPLVRRLLVFECSLRRNVTMVEQVLPAERQLTGLAEGKIRLRQLNPNVKQFEPCCVTDDDGWRGGLLIHLNALSRQVGLIIVIFAEEQSDELYEGLPATRPLHKTGDLNVWNLKPVTDDMHSQAEVLLVLRAIMRKVAVNSVVVTFR